MCSPWIFYIMISRVKCCFSCTLKPVERVFCFQRGSLAESLVNNGFISLEIADCPGIQLPICNTTMTSRLSQHERAESCNETQTWCCNLSSHHCQSLLTLMTCTSMTHSPTTTRTYSWQCSWDLPAIIAVDLYSGLKGHRLRPSSVTTSPVSLLTREKLAVFWRTHIWSIYVYVHGWEKEQWPMPTSIRQENTTQLVFTSESLVKLVWWLWIGLRGLEKIVETKWEWELILS